MRRTAPFLRGPWCADDLQEFLRGCSERGLSLVSVDHFLAEPSDKAVALLLERFDAAFAEVARPILESHGVFGSVVVESARVGQVRRRSLRDREVFPPWSVLRSLVAEGGDVVSGGHHGASLRSLSAEVAYGELLRSRCEIERRVGRAPRALRYPFGEVSPEMAEIARSAGFELGLCPPGRGVEDDLLRHEVLRPGRFESPARFARRLAEGSGRGPHRAAASG